MSVREKIRFRKIIMSVMVVALMLTVIMVPIMTVKVSAQLGHVVGADGYLVPHYFGPYPNYATSDLPVVEYDQNGNIVSVTGGIRKFVDSLPGLTEAAANNLGNYIPVAYPDTTTYAGCEYYEIALVEFEQKMHTDIAPTKLRGYVQLETPANFATSKHVQLTYLNGTPIRKGNGELAIAYDNPMYLGPFIIASKDLPVRLTFHNLLPTGAAGNLFLPVDKTMMGAGMGPEPVLDGLGNPVLGPNGMPLYYEYTENRATIHLHGGRTPWISDGTPHQWITPANEDTPYPEGVSVYNVPDMPDPGPGAMTFYYTNGQSARLMFYHDHTYGITRLGVYAGGASGYLLRDEVELGLISSGIIPSDEIPLVLQDKTFVPDDTTPITNMWGTFDSQLAFQDPTWNTTKWGTPGDLWYPHVYMTMQHPSDPSGSNMFGRWHYAPWFWPPGQVANGPVPNPYYNPADPNNPMEPELIPGTPNPSNAAEAFLDTPVINGAAYPYMEIEPKAYRFRVLNAADDRFFNLQMYIADPNVTTFDGRTNTEVKMVPAVATPGYPEGWPTDGREGGVPDPAMAGPEFIQIGNEGGFLPTPVVLPNQPVDWNWDQGTFDFAILNKFTLLLGSAERADVIVDFSQYAGKTIILYNDCPAPTPASDPRQDYFTGHPDYTDVGGSQTTIAGYGSNTRTIMQIRVANSTPAPAYNVTNLMNAFITNSTQVGAYKQSQHDPIVPQAYYNSALGTNYTNNYFSRIETKSLTYTPIGTTTPVTIEYRMKAIQDEMGESYDHEYGRMAVNFGLQYATPQGQAMNLLLYGYSDPPTEILAPDLNMTQVTTLPDGTEIWMIVHNGVDTHPVHWHMFEVQLLNRVAWDNNIREPDPNELGWKETIRVNPLQNTIVALRPLKPVIPFQVPNSIRPLDVTKPLGEEIGLNVFSPNGQPVTILNHEVNFGYEYVWHCHILAHEENDMMRTMAAALSPVAPSNLKSSLQGNRMVLTWNDNSISETGFQIQRSTDKNFLTNVVTFTVGEGVTTYTDTTINPRISYFYRVCAINVVGDTFDYSAANPAVENFPTTTAKSGYSNVAGPPLGTARMNPITQASKAGSPMVLRWQYTGGGQTGFVIQRSTSPNFATGLKQVFVGPTATTYSDSSFVAGQRYYYRIAPINGAAMGAWSNVVSFTPHA